MVFTLLSVTMTGEQKVIKPFTSMDKPAACVYPAVHVQQYVLTLWKDCLPSEMHKYEGSFSSSLIILRLIPPGWRGPVGSVGWWGRYVFKNYYTDDLVKTRVTAVLGAKCHH